MVHVSLHERDYMRRRVSDEQIRRYEEERIAAEYGEPGWKHGTAGRRVALGCMVLIAALLILAILASRW